MHGNQEWQEWHWTAFPIQFLFRAVFTKFISSDIMEQSNCPEDCDKAECQDRVVEMVEFQTPLQPLPVNY